MILHSDIIGSFCLKVSLKRDRIIITGNFERDVLLKYQFKQ